MTIVHLFPLPEKQPRVEIPNTPEPAYAELAVTTNFSFLRGGSHPEELVERARKLRLTGLGIADRNTVAGVVRAHMAAKDDDAADGTKTKVVPGARLVFADGTPDILAYPQDRAAWGRLTRLLTVGKSRGDKAECILFLDDLLEHIGGLNLIVMPSSTVSAGLSTVVPTDPGLAPGESRDPYPAPDREDTESGFPPARGRRERKWERQKRILHRLREAAPDSVWLAASMLYRGDDARRIARLAELAAETNLPPIAVNDVLYHAPERRPLQDVITCIREHVTIREAGRRLEANAERHLKSPQEMERLFRKIPGAVSQTLNFLNRCRFSLDELRKTEYPEEARQGFATPQDALAALVKDGERRRYPNGMQPHIRQALDKELAITAELKYAPYFLTVYDIVRFAKSKGILCQGRGSAANSVICYCLGITEVDPEKVDLLFERFVSAERREPPDIDVDFEHERREEVIQYIYRKYGREQAGLAATVIRYRGRSAIREVGKVFGLSDDAIGALAGTLWGWSMAGVQDKEARRAGLDPSDPELQRVMALAQELMGFPRHLSQHVGGFVITRSRLDEVVPVENAAMDDRTVIEWDKDDLNDLELLKVDVLGLGMLSCLRRGFDLLRIHYNQRVTLPFILRQDEDDDRAIYRMISRADTIGVFQIESRAQMSMLPRLKPAQFYDLVIEVAIVRPGPIQGNMVHPYLRRREGKEPVVYPSQEMKDILHKTLGVPLFQEHAMRIAIVGAGFQPGEADRLRRAMATFKRVGTIDRFREKFIKGMIARGYDEAFTIDCWKQIEGFGSYGFPESHAASFANLVYASAWIKCRYPDVFAAALLNSQPMGFYATSQIVRDAQEHGVEVRPADVNQSDWDCTLEPLSTSPTFPLSSRPSERSERESGSSNHRPFGRSQTRGLLDPRFRGGDDGEKSRRSLHPRHAGMKDDIRTTHAVRLGLREISGFSENDARTIESVRGKGFDSVRDLWLRTRLQPAALEKLAHADAFRSLGLDRRDALWAVQALRRAGDKDDLPLFAHAAMAELEPDASLPPMLPGQQVVEDYRHLHLSLRAHPMSFLRADLDARGIVRHDRLPDVPNGRRVTIAGIVLVRQRPGIGNAIFMTLEDETGIANTILWPRTFEKFRPIVMGARLIGVTGQLQNEKGVIHIVGDRFEDLTPLLRRLNDASGVPPRSRADMLKADSPDRFRHPRSGDSFVRMAKTKPALTQLAAAEHAARVLPKGRNFH
jgi:error-prone DNA polymerase